MSVSDRERYRRARGIFHAAVDLDPGERPAFLSEACDDPELRREVEILLDAADATTDRVLPGGAGGEPPSATPVPIRVGGERSYRLVEEIGRGGMGTVYRAEREGSDFRQEVALKLIRPDCLGPAFFERLRRERRILARLEHPNVARLLDGGSTEDGAPFLAMELVEGEPIDRYCRRLRLPLADRLRLFSRVCLAVHHAHRMLVVHGDLKPANVLVDGRGEPKLLDFGVARLLRGDDPEAGDSGADRERGMTRSHASPEQLRGEALTTASDVYALGVVLCQLLTGRLPHDPDPTAPSGAAEPARGQPPRPPSEIARRHEPRLARRLSGDLDAVVLKALAPDPGDRYASAAELAADLERHLGGHPVAARKTPPLERAGRFVRRHPLPSLAAAALVVLGLAFVVTVQLEERRTARQRDRAERVIETLEAMFEITDPGAGEAGGLGADEILRRGQAIVERELGDEPEVAAAVRTTIGRLLRYQGRYDDSVAVLEQALDERRRLLGDRHLEVAETLHELGVSRTLAGDLEDAEAALTEALDVRLERGAEDGDTADLRSDLGSLRLQQGEFEAAEAELLAALALERRLYGDDDPEVIATHSNLGRLYQRTGDLERAEVHHRTALRLLRRDRPPDHPDVALGANNLGLVYQALGRYAEAEPLLREALELAIARLGEDHPNVGIAHDNLGGVLHELGDLDAAEAMAEKAQAIFRRSLGDDHLSVAISLANLAKIALDRGRPEEAVSRLREAETIAVDRLGSDHPTVATVRTHLGGALVAAGRPAEAGPLLIDAERVLRQAHGDGHPMLATNLFRQARMVEALGDGERAEALHRDALRRRERLLAPGNLDLAESRGALAALLLARGEAAEAAALAAETLAARRSALPAGDPRIAEAQRLLDRASAASAPAASR